MKSIFIDANIILRILTKDDEKQMEKAESLFSKAISGDVLLVCGPPVLFEVAWTLEARYKVSNSRILDYIEALLATPGLMMTDRKLVENGVSRSRHSGVEFADAYIAALAEINGCDSIATFNVADFKKLNATLHPL